MLAWASSIGTSALVSSAGFPLATSCKKPPLNFSVRTGNHFILTPYRITMSSVLSIALYCSPVICSGPTPFASRVCDFLWFSEMSSTSGRSYSYSMTAAKAVISRESFGSRRSCDVDGRRNRSRSGHICMSACIYLFIYLLNCI